MRNHQTYFGRAWLFLTACALSACGGSATSPVTASGTTPTANPTVLTIALSAASYSVAQSAGTVAITVTRSGSSGASSVNYATSNGTAASGSDYTASSGTLSWADGDGGTQSFSVPLSSTPFSGSKTFTVTLSGVSGATLGSLSSAVVTVTGSGTATAALNVKLSASTYSVAQSAGSVAITVARSGSSGTTSVNYATSNGTALSGTNYTAASGTLSWNDGDAGTKAFTVPLSATPFSGAKNFTVTLSSATGATLGSPASALVTITGTTVPATLTVKLAAATYSAAQSAGTVAVTATRSGPSGTTTVNYATSNGTAMSGTNYTATSGTLSWSNGDAGSKSFNVPLSSTAFSGSKTFTVTLSNPVGASLGSPASAVVTVAGGTAAAGGGPAAKLAAKLGLPSRLLLGLGGYGPSDIQAQALKVDIYEQYLGAGDWTSWNSPPCDYVCVIATDAHTVGAIPMYTYYQMANNGDGNIASANDSAFMTTYWARVKLMYQDIAASNKPALVVFEPDFWGYVERQAPNSDPTQVAAVVSSNPDCSTLANNIVGYTGCLIAMGRKYAPNAYIGIPPSSWGGDSNAAVVAFMNAVGAQKADFIVEQTLDRDAGCFEAIPQPSYCARSATGLYWDETNQTHPNFQDHLAEAQAYHSGIGNLPIIWWQTPLGVPSATPGGTDSHYRDNRVHYFLTHPAELTAVGGLGVVFSGGASHQTSITTDGGQFQTLTGEYLMTPAVLP
jgi:Calx-beta domain